MNIRSSKSKKQVTFKFKDNRLKSKHWVISNKAWPTINKLVLWAINRLKMPHNRFSNKLTRIKITRLYRIMKLAMFSCRIKCSPSKSLIYRNSLNRSYLSKKLLLVKYCNNKLCKIKLRTNQLLKKMVIWRNKSKW